MTLPRQFRLFYVSLIAAVLGGCAASGLTDQGLPAIPKSEAQTRAVVYASLSWSGLIGVRSQFALRNTKTDKIYYVSGSRDAEAGSSIKNLHVSNADDRLVYIEIGSSMAAASVPPGNYQLAVLNTDDKAIAWGPEDGVPLVAGKMYYLGHLTCDRLSSDLCVWSTRDEYVEDLAFANRYYPDLDWRHATMALPPLAARASPSRNDQPLRKTTITYAGDVRSVNLGFDFPHAVGQTLERDNLIYLYDKAQGAEYRETDSDRKLTVIARPLGIAGNKRIQGYLTPPLRKLIIRRELLISANRYQWNHPDRWKAPKSQGLMPVAVTIDSKPLLGYSMRVDDPGAAAERGAEFLVFNRGDWLVSCVITGSESEDYGKLSALLEAMGLGKIKEDAK